MMIYARMEIRPAKSRSDSKLHNKRDKTNAVPRCLYVIVICHSAFPARFNPPLASLLVNIHTYRSDASFRHLSGLLAAAMPYLATGHDPPRAFQGAQQQGRFLIVEGSC
mmetsp:Transcript_1021/g.1454  ORF Transcript_1021/g.1454 Transcript_1021/m.1454 type:complete len:109 (+) Transcript_1021:107-433(+)